MPSQHPAEIGYGHVVESYETRTYGGRSSGSRTRVIDLSNIEARDQFEIIKHEKTRRHFSLTPSCSSRGRATTS